MDEQLRQLQAQLEMTTAALNQAMTQPESPSPEKPGHTSSEASTEADPKKKGRLPASDEIRRRFQDLAETLPGQHGRVFQPFFQNYVEKQLMRLREGER